MPGWLELVWQYGGRILLFVIAGVLLLSLKKNLGRLVAEGFPAGGSAPASKRVDRREEKAGVALGGI